MVDKVRTGTSRQLFYPDQLISLGKRMPRTTSLVATTPLAEKSWTCASTASANSQTLHGLAGLHGVPRVRWWHPTPTAPYCRWHPTSSVLHCRWHTTSSVLHCRWTTTPTAPDTVGGLPHLQRSSSEAFPGGPLCRTPWSHTIVIIIGC